MSEERETKTLTVITANPATPQIDASAMRLIEMLRWRRPAGSKTERRWIDKVIRPVGVEQDAYGNLYKLIGPNPKILWSAHTDTVHDMGGQQTIHLGGGFLRLSDAEKQSNCLGADNTTGCWMLLEMIREGIPGLYIFHRDEESGGKGSRWIAKNEKDGLLKGIDAAIAFDRKGMTSIITHQSGARTASKAFADSVAECLGKTQFKADDSGLFTDTDSYAHIISECTNISVGMENCHSRMERQSLPFAMWLKSLVLKADWSQLAIKRDPAKDNEYRYGSGYRYGHWANYMDGANDEYMGKDYESDTYWEKTPEGAYIRRKRAMITTNTDVSHGRITANAYDIRSLLIKYPDVVADFLEREGYTIEALRDEVEGVYGNLWKGS